MQTELGITVTVRNGIPYADRLRMIRAAGFDATSLWWEEAREEIRRMRHLAPDMVRTAGLRIDHIHVPYHGCQDLWSSDSDARAAIVARHISWVDDCRRHEIPLLVMHIAMGSRTPTPNEHGVESMRRIVDAAEDAGVCIAIENTRLPGHVCALLEEIESPALGLCFDTSHDRLYSESPMQLLRDRGHRLVTTHLSDTDGKRDYHWLPGEGCIEFEDVMRQVGSSYSGCLMLEVTPKDKQEDFEAFLARAYRSGRTVQGLFEERVKTLSF